MIASLMMYARPELAAANERLWAGIRARLIAAGIQAPEDLSNEADPLAVWTDPELVLSQTCGYPFRKLLLDKVTLVGTPDYGLQDCPPGYYRSAIVVRASDERNALTDYQDAIFAFNDTMSQSGFAAPYTHCHERGFWFENRVRSGSHLDSAQWVATGRADIAALDAVTWDLIQQYEPWAHTLRVLDWTTPTPGLPLITAQHERVAEIGKAFADAIDALDPDDRHTLGLKGLVHIPTSDYLAVPNPPPDAAGQPGAEL